MAEEEKKKKKPFYKKWWVWLIVIILAIGIFGSSGDDEVADGPEKVESEETEEESEEEKEEDVENTEFGVGDKVKLDGQVVEVTEVEKSKGDNLGLNGEEEVGKGTEKGENEKNEKETEEEKEEEVENTEFCVGDKVKLDGQVVEVTEVKKSQGDDFETPSEGNEFVIVHVAIENNGEDEISYNPFNFKMKNSDGQIEDEGMLMVDSDTSLSAAYLAPGGNVSGTLSFEQPKDDDGLELISEPGFWGTDEVVFNLSK